MPCWPSSTRSAAMASGKLPINMLHRLQLAHRAYTAAVQRGDYYEEQLERAMQQLADTNAALEEIRTAFAELKAVVLERNRAEQCVRELHRERAIQRARAAERDPNARLN